MTTTPTGLANVAATPIAAHNVWCDPNNLLRTLKPTHVCMSMKTCCDASSMSSSVSSTLPGLAIAVTEQDARQFVRAARVEFPREVVALHAGIPSHRPRPTRTDQVGVTGNWVAAPVRVRLIDHNTGRCLGENSFPLRTHQYTYVGPRCGYRVICGMDMEVNRAALIGSAQACAVSGPEATTTRVTAQSNLPAPPQQLGGDDQLVRGRLHVRLQIQPEGVTEGLAPANCCQECTPRANCSETSLPLLREAVAHYLVSVPLLLDVLFLRGDGQHVVQPNGGPLGGLEGCGA